MKRLGLTAAAVLVLVGPGAARAARVHLVVTPATVAAGRTVTVSAASSPCLVRDRVTLISAAFPGHAFGEGAVYGRIGRNGSFSVRVRIPSTLRPGDYHVGARCGGGNLGVSAVIHVRAARRPASSSSLPVTASGRYVVAGTAMARVGGAVYVGGDFTFVANRTGSAIVVPEAGGAPAQTGAEVAGGSVDAAITDGDGGWYIAGAFTSVGGVPRPGLARLHADGTLDLAFAPPALGRVNALALAGSVLYVGGVTGRGTSIAPVLVALQAATGAPSKIALQPLPVTSDTPTGVTALLAAGGRLYAGFGPDGVAAYAAAGGAPIWHRLLGFGEASPSAGATALALDGSELLVGGWFQDAGNKNLEALVAASGTPTGPPLSVTADGVSAIAVIGGSAYLARPGSSGVAVVDLATGAWHRWGDVNPGTLVADGTTLLVAGRTAADLRYTTRVYSGSAGAAQPSLRPVSPVLAGGANALATQAGRLLIGGTFVGAGGSPRADLAAFDVRTGALLPWRPAADAMVSALAVAGRTIYLAGQFTHVSGAPRDGLAAVDAVTGRLLPWNPSAPGVDALAAARGRVFAGGTILRAGRRTRHLVAFSAAGTGRLLWSSPVATWNVDALAVSGDTLLAAGPSVIALPLTGTGRTALWHSSTNGAVFALAMRGSTLYAGGRFTRIAGQTRSNLAALALDRRGSLLPFAPPVQPTVQALASVGADLVYSSTSRMLGAVAPTGALEPWQVPGDGYASAIVPAPGGLVVTGNFTWLGPVGHQAAGGVAWLP